MTARRSNAPPVSGTTGRFPRHVWVAYGVGFLLFASVPLVLLAANRQEAYDLAIYDQSIWLLSNGSWFNTVAGIHVFGAHFSPVLFLLQPLTLVSGGAVPELVFEAWVLAATVFPLHRVAVRLDRPSGPLLWAFVLHPAVFTASWFGFHPWTLAAPYIALATVILLRRPRWSTLGFLAVAGLVFREDIGFWVVVIAAMLAVAGHLPWRQWLIGAVPGGLASAGVVFGLMPEWSPVDGYLYASSFLGEESSVDATTFLASTAVRVVYLVVPLGLGLATIRRIRWSIAVPLIIPLVGLGLRGGNALSTAFHYDLHLALAAILLVALSRAPVARVRDIVIGAAVAALALGALRPTTPDIGPNPWGILSRDADLSEAREAVASLDDGSRSLAVPTQLLPHFSERPRAFIFPAPFDQISREPYAMSCPPPEIVVEDRLAPDTPGWDSARPSYAVDTDTGRYVVLVYTGVAPSDDSCGPVR